MKWKPSYYGLEGMHVDALALNDADAIVGAVEQGKVADDEVFAAVDENLG
jgi:hypothetical protein